MKILLQQHGAALAPTPDAERVLTAQGRNDIEHMAIVLQAGAVRVQQVLHSGKQRAQQTAEIMAHRIGSPNALAAVAGLAPDDPVKPFCETLDGLDNDTLVVGHQPFMGRLASILVTGRTEPPLVRFVPGAVVCLERDLNGGYAVTWMLPPTLAGPCAGALAASPRTAS